MTKQTTKALGILKLLPILVRKWKLTARKEGNEPILIIATQQLL